MISFLVGRKNGPRVEIPKPPQRKSQKNMGATPRKALKSKDFRKYLNWSYTPYRVDVTDFSYIRFFFAKSIDKDIVREYTLMI